ncbi:hypothetical protein [Streptomyces sp. SID13031]|uniref:hypothetical protein n=1 Tax=Streptomyces sp. SID13031 TaxID=2706046 RepID=UPI0013CAB729|nr:hypothetical protein [Streptomyces sp. SID13031]NEA35051.1 hypothetical protein [Streptomyces sp. SID13031]
MKRFVVPPSWPTPPRRSWTPPKTWRPDPAWPAAPDDWKFWIDGKGNAVRGPVGLYGGPSRRVVALGAGGLMLFLAVNFWALSAIGLFDGGPADSQAVPVVDDSTPSPSAPVKPTTPPKTTTTAEGSAPPPVVKTTRPPSTPTPTKTKTTKKREDRDPTPTKPTTTKPTAKPTPRPTPSRPPTREEMIEQYCAAQGYDPAWCDPENWPDSDGP